MENKQVKEITPMDVDFSKWYTDIVRKADLADYSSVKGCMVIRPYGYAIWENMQKILDADFKALGHENVYMPLFIPGACCRWKRPCGGFAGSRMDNNGLRRSLKTSAYVRHRCCFGAL